MSYLLDLTTKYSIGLICIQIECPDAIKEMMLKQIHISLVELTFISHESDPHSHQEANIFYVFPLSVKTTKIDYMIYSLKGI